MPVGQCRLRAPIAADTPLKWPVTQSVDWCGEFVAKGQGVKVEQ